MICVVLGEQLAKLVLKASARSALSNSCTFLYFPFNHTTYRQPAVPLALEGFPHLSTCQRTDRSARMSHTMSHNTESTKPEDD